MAKKITIAFTDNPSIGESLKYNVLIDGTPIPYSGFNALNIGFGVSTNISNVEIKATLEETLDELLYVLSTFYRYSVITYAKISDGVEVFINHPEATVSGIFSTSSITVTHETVNISEGYFLKYYMTYIDIMNVDYRVELLGKGFVGTAKEIQGYATLAKGGTKSALDPIRGTGLNIELEADIDLTFEDLYSDDENQYKARFYRGGTLLFIGFLKPDGIYQSFVRDRWKISVTCVDGLGILKDLAFVQNSGFQWTDKQSAIEIIRNCLIRTNTLIDINTSINIYYEGLTPSDILDPLAQIYMSVNRFVKTDNDTIMDCEQVLKSVLDLFKAQITQFNGQWYIDRVNEIVEQPNVKYRRYNATTGNYSGINTKKQAFELGSQINNRYPHHCGGNQQINIKPAVSAYRINYKYGFISGILSNPSLIRDEYDYLSWDEYDMSNVVFDPLKDSGVSIESALLNTKILSSQAVFVKEGDSVKLKVKYKGVNTLNTFSIAVPFQIRQGVNYLVWGEGFTVGPPEWTTATNVFTTFNATKDIKDSSYIFELDIPAFLSDGDLTIDLWTPSHQADEVSALVTLNSIDFINTTVTNNGAIGEFHTVQRKNRPSSIARETDVIYNGDSPSIIFEGAIFKNDQTTPTSFWFRRNRVESKPILQIAAEETLRANPRPAKEFTGDAYGYIPYLSLVSIDSITGVFKFTEYSFNSKINTTSFKLIEVFSTELPDIDYTLSYDYGETVKPTITS